MLGMETGALREVRETFYISVRDSAAY